jgi:cytochrome c oxidase subunit IV
MSENVAAAEHGHVAAGEHASGHPGPALYALVAIALVILTFMELAVYYVSFLQPLLVPILILLALAKFLLVGGFYMHLYYDQKIFSIFFVFPLILACFIGAALMMIFSALESHLVL